MNAHAMPDTFSPQQSEALIKVRKWLDSGDQQVFRLFGYAGTGKTTLAREFAANMDGTVLFGAFTGKAADVLRKKGCADASTIHSMIYQVKQGDGGEIKVKKKPKAEFEGVKLIIIDECSMVGEDIGKDLLSYRIPVLVLGDPAQLPPVKGGGFFTDFAADYMLTEVHRQAEGNPIIEMSMKIRRGERLSHGTFGAVDIITPDDITTERILGSDMVLLGTNKRRQRYNARMRELSGREGEYPVPGDELVCLKNDHEKGLYNGSLWVVDTISERGSAQRLLVRSQDDPNRMVAALVDPRSWDEAGWKEVDWREKRGLNEFTYGYALTVHKSQGSQWDDVVLFDESGAFRESADRWLYTGVTRAAERLTVVKS